MIMNPFEPNKWIYWGVLQKGAEKNLIIQKRAEVQQDQEVSHILEIEMCYYTIHNKYIYCPGAFWFLKYLYLPNIPITKVANNKR